MNKFKLTCIASIGLLSACATTIQKPAFETTPQTVTPPVEHKTRAPSSITSWDLSGAMAARNNKKGWTATLNWLQQGPNEYQIRLFGPLGGGTVMIEKKGSVVTFRDGPKTVSSGNADALLQKETGVGLPVKNLYYWVRGLPAPSAIQVEQHDSNHHLTTLNQAGYTIEYTGYTSVNGIELPSKIRLQGHGVTIKFVIKHWKV